MQFNYAHSTQQMSDFKVRKMEVPMSKIKLNRGQIGRNAGLDITVKSAGGWARAFTPTWPMVMGYKQGTISDQEYTQAYLKIIERAQLTIVSELVQYGRAMGDRVTFLCYCKDGAFCHTHILIEYLTRNWPGLFEDTRTAPVRIL